MKRILDRYFWLIFPIIIVSIFQGISLFIFILTLFDTTFYYVFEGFFEYSDIKIRANMVASLMQIPAILFWSTLFIISKRKK